MYKHLLLCKLCLFCSFLGCSSESEHFISDGDYRREVEGALDAKKPLFADSALFSVFERKDISAAEREALEFLYAYMPIGDVADYDGEFYLENVRASFEARREMPWGKVVPEDIFRHFVLPVRVNNENLDSSRIVFYRELRDRVMDLPLYDAVLEVNHWCHEKVVYTPSDSRTSAPLASVRSAYGRCGEESTFTVAALRAVGIPARQVYVPRWAHTDDNHAWVEAWVDGKWLFMGACEPEPTLNLGWFNGPAYRSMLMHTKVFGSYYGPEDVMERTECYTEINVIDNYASTAKTTVTVRDADGSAVEGALVEFKIYNYAEFYTVARKTTDAEGRCSLTAGKGDMLVWATKDGRFGYGKASFGTADSIDIVLDKTPGDTASVELDIVPPPEGSIPAPVTPEQQKANQARLQREDSIREAYTATFYTDETVKNSMKSLYKDVDVAGFLVRSRGNHHNIEKFLLETPDDRKTKAVSLLTAISRKDLRDTPAETLEDHLNNTPDIAPDLLDNSLYYSDLYNRYLLNPRVANELLTPYKSFFAKHIDKSLAEAARANPGALVEWVKTNIKSCDELNPQSIPVMPEGVWKARIADAHSRDIFFVSVARSLGIPARIEAVTKKVQFYDKGWVDVDFEASTVRANSAKGFVQASYKPVKTADNPLYYSHFTIAKILPDATLQTLNFESQSQVDMGGGNTWKALFSKPLSLDEGNYLLVTGTRMASGKVLARLNFFSVRPNALTTTELVMREDSRDLQVIGSIEAEKPALIRETESTPVTILDVTGRGYFIIGILGLKQEPTNHTLRDIALFKSDFEKWGRSIILLFEDDASLRSFNKNEFGALPSTCVYGVDFNGEIVKMIASTMNLDDAKTLPVFIVADTFGRVIFFSQGYTIGLGEQLLKTVKSL